MAGILPFDQSGTIPSNATPKTFDFTDHFAGVPVYYVRLTLTTSGRLWLVMTSGAILEYTQGVQANIPVELSNYSLKAVKVQPTAAGATYWVHATTIPPGQCDGGT